MKDFLKVINTYYGEVRTYKPPTSRKTSSESYIIAQGRKNTQIDRFSKDSLYKDEE
ncbi:MAG: SAM-dependent methyltransferase [Candidatus Hodarchaeales archaeon]